MVETQTAIDGYITANNGCAHLENAWTGLNTQTPVQLFYCFTDPYEKGKVKIALDEVIGIVVGCYGSDPKD